MFKSFPALILLLLLISNSIAVEEECTDVQGNMIAHGMLFVPGPSVCSLCTCWNGEPLWCKAIYCDPPFFCKDFRLGNRCCEWECLDKPGENELYELRIKKRDEILAGTGGSITMKPSIIIMIIIFIRIHSM